MTILPSSEIPIVWATELVATRLRSVPQGPRREKGDSVFKNLMIYRLVSGWPGVVEPLAASLELPHFGHCGTS